ncbi:hypothetical protein SAMN02910455_01777 [Acidaminococcus fermentans]|nr:hypothetical protein SAMN02910455_01777 [Acidaminococcus fermentans]
MNYITKPKDSTKESSQSTTDSSRTPSPDQLLKMQSARITQLEQEKAKMTARIKELESQLQEQSKGVSIEDLNTLSDQLNEAINKTVILNDKQLEYQSERIRDAVNREIKNIHIPRPNIPRPPFWWYIEPYVLIGVAVFSFFFLYGMRMVSHIDNKTEVLSRMDERIARIQWNVSFPDDPVGLTTPIHDRWVNQLKYESEQQKE